MATNEEKSGGAGRVSTQETLDYLTKVFLYIGDQRLKTFNYYAIILAATVGMTGIAVKEGFPALCVVAGGMHVVVAFVFFVIDTRNRGLLGQARAALRACEKEAFPDDGTYRLISNDEAETSGKSGWRRIASYTTAFRTLYAAQVLFGIGIIVWSFNVSPK